MCKLTDIEIEKALECCFNRDFEDCKECPLENEFDELFSCMNTRNRLTLDYINRLKAENERLQAVADAELDTIHDMGEDYERVLEEEPMLIQKAKAEAIKEFAERLKKEFKPEINYGVVANCAIKLFRNTIDYLVKEMTEKE